MTLQNTIRDLIYKFWNLDDLSVDEVVPFFETLINCGCDFFELANELTQIAIPIPFDLMYAVFCLCPKAIKIRDIKTQTIRGLIPRWTSTKYHSGPIDQVIQDIQEKIISGNRGLYTYHSNFSPNKSSVDDPYLLLVGSHDVHFFDINRRRAYLFEYTCEEGKNDSPSGM